MQIQMFSVYVCVKILEKLRTVQYQQLDCLKIIGFKNKCFYFFLGRNNVFKIIVPYSQIEQK